MNKDDLLMGCRMEAESPQERGTSDEDLQRTAPEIIGTGGTEDE